MSIDYVLVRGVRAIKGLFGSDSSKSTKFGPEVDNTIWFTFDTCYLHPTGWRPCWILPRWWPHWANL